MIKKKSFITYLLLTLCTFGIYSIVFWHEYTEDINRMDANREEELPNYTTVFMFSILTCGIYNLIWYNKVGSKIYRIGEENGIPVFLDGPKAGMLRMSGFFGAVLITIIGQAIGIGPEYILRDIVMVVYIGGAFIPDYFFVKSINLFAEDYNHKINLL